MLPKILLIGNIVTNYFRDIAKDKIDGQFILKNDYTFLYAENTDKAYEIIQNHSIDSLHNPTSARSIIDLIIIDLSIFPLKNNFVDIPLIVMLENNNSENLVKALIEGCSDYIFLPCKAEEAHLRIDTQIKLHAALKINRNLNRDNLTKAYNKDYFIYRVSSCVQIYSIIMIDIDNFKQVNDIYGHLVGDKILKELKERLIASLRSEDILARFGGDEFVASLFIPSELAELVAKRLCQDIAKEKFYNSISVTASFGVATSDNKKKLDIVIDEADQALRQAKQQGKNKVVVFKKVQL